MTSSDRWRHVERLYHDALERGEGERAEFLRAACGADEVLRREVESLLAYGEAQAFMATPALDVAAASIDAGKMNKPLAGERLGPYEIGSRLGSGGMGDVYRARDTRLGRDVAIKILPEVFTADADRRARFEREARLLAALNHPHIGAIYGLEDREGVHALVLELIEGPTLAERLRGGRLPIREALTIARQIAEALEAAHEKGIVHRDLKPANIAITREGVVKVLDFGLAKIGRAGGAGSEEGSDGLSDSPTITIAGTLEGLILGTAAYMSPEQARGKVVDKRTDIWAFGCVLYEMLTGRRAVARDTVSDAIAAILEREPDWGALPPATPSTIRRLLERCLEKDPKRRLHDIADARIEIDDTLEAPATDAAADARPPMRRLRIAVWTMAGLLAGALITAVVMRFTWTPAADSVARFTITLPERVALGFGIALSPDGRTLVYSGRDEVGYRLYKRTVDALESAPIRGSEGGRVPFFSPDGAWVAFSAGRALKKVLFTGGSAITISETLGGQGASAWLADDTIIVATEGRGLLRIPASGGDARKVTSIDSERGELEHRWPVALPGDRAVLFTAHYGGQDSQRVHVVSLASGQRTPLVQGNGARFLPTGHIAFQRAGSMWAAPFDLSRLELTGPPTPVIDGVAIAEDWSPIFTVARNGAVAYAQGGEPYPPRTLAWVDRTGREERIDAPARAWFWPQISPDGKRLGFHIMDPTNMDAWIYELDHGPLVRVTYHPLQDGYPLWTPDGKQVVFWSRQAGDVANLYVRSADLTGSDRRLTTSPNNHVPMCWSADGKLLVFQQDSPDTKTDIGVVPIDGGHTPQLLIHGPSDEQNPSVSPDGRWIAYQSNLSGRWEVYVQPFPGLDGRWQVSMQGGVSPLWHPKGRELFYRNDHAVMSVPVETAGASFRHGNPKVLFEGSYVGEDPAHAAWNARSYVLRPDGERFLMMKEPAAARDKQVVVVLNWLEEVKRLVPSKP